MSFTSTINNQRLQNNFLSFPTIGSNLSISTDVKENPFLNFISEKALSLDFGNFSKNKADLLAAKNIYIFDSVDDDFGQNHPIELIIELSKITPWSYREIHNISSGISLRFISPEARVHALLDDFETELTSIIRVEPDKYKLDSGEDTCEFSWGANRISYILGNEYCHLLCYINGDFSNKFFERYEANNPSLEAELKEIITTLKLTNVET